MNATTMNVEAIKAQLQALRFPDLVWNKETKEHDEVEKPCTIFMEGNVIRVSAEDGLGVADYYGEFRGGYAWIHPELEKFAADRGGFWEWRDASCIGLYF